ncbi:MAG: phage tail protein [Thermaceae bacterium]|nr:phage tail protein [Thermaceae bacterium]
MSEPFIGEVKIISFNFPPRGWAFCNGQLLPIAQNQALFSILGTTFGGDGRQNFGLPNLQGRVPFHLGNGFVLGQVGGEQAHTLNQSELPTHTHALQASSSAATSNLPTGNVLAAPKTPLYGPAASLTGLIPASLAPVGGSQPHNNMQPYLVLNFVIALQGIFPTQN